MVTQDEFLNPFLTQSLGNSDFKVYSLAGDASNRRYYRVVHNNQSFVLMRWEPYNPDNYPFISVLRHFEKNGIHVPKIIGMAPSDGLMLLEDLGDLTLERKFWESQDKFGALDFYKQAIDEVAKIHNQATDNRGPCTAFDIEFNTEKFLWEMNYGKQNLIEGILKFKFSEKAQTEIDRIFLSICTKLDQEPKRIAHRDYHSRNLMIKLNNMHVIDFQDARLGPIQYDLVSLFRDSYVDMSDELAETLMNYYLELSKDYLPENFSKEHFLKIYELQSIQRCFKACGSFASFFHLREDRRYLKYLPGTLRKVIKATNEFPEYKAFADILIDSGALERKYESL